MGLPANFIYGVTDSAFVNGKVGIAFWVVLDLAAGVYRVARAPAGQ